MIPSLHIVSCQSFRIGIRVILCYLYPKEWKGDVPPCWACMKHIQNSTFKIQHYIAHPLVFYLDDMVNIVYFNGKIKQNYVRCEKVCVVSVKVMSGSTGSRFMSSWIPAAEGQALCGYDRKESMEIMKKPLNFKGFSVY